MDIEALCERLPQTRHGETRTTNGRMTRTKEYMAWEGMRARCLNTREHNYHAYGGRGITICARWLMGFENFLEDMGRAPSTQHSLDRINVDGSYEPSNCRWATKQQQYWNRRNQLMITHDGQTRCLAEWATILGKNYYTLWTRIKARGWSIEDAFTR